MRVGKFALIRPVITSTDGPLRGDDEVDAGRARELRQPADLALDFERRRHHQVRQLVDDHDPVRQLLDARGLRL